MYRHWSFPDSQSSSLKISIISYCESYNFLQCIVCVFQKMWFKITRKLSFSPSVAHEHELQLMFCLLLFPSGESRTLLYHFSDYFSFVLEASLILIFCSFACKIKIYAKNDMFFLFRLLITLALLSLNERLKIFRALNSRVWNILGLREARGIIPQVTLPCCSITFPMMS